MAKNQLSGQFTKEFNPHNNWVEMKNNNGDRAEKDGLWVPERETFVYSSNEPDSGKTNIEYMKSKKEK